MSRTNWKGVVLPSAGDSLLGAWDKMADTLGVIVPASSVSSARAMLTKAEIGGNAPTQEHPAWLMVGGILYLCDGTKNQDGVWTVRPVNETQTAESRVTESREWTVPPGGRYDIAYADVGVRPYDRRVEAVFTCYGQVTQGTIDLHLTIGSVNQLARFAVVPYGTSVSVTCSALVEAGSSPSVRGGVTGGASTGNSTLGVTAATGYSALLAKAYPVSMA